MSDSPPASLLVHGATLIDAHGAREGWVLTRGAVIAETGEGSGWRRHAREAARVVDAGGAVLAPGFVDLHGHGGAGVAYDDDADPAAALRLHRAHGTTRSVLSLVSAPIDAQERSLARIAGLAARDPLVLGAHLEGPYLAPGRRGAHDPAALTTPDPDLVQRQLRAARGFLRMVTLAPELEGAEQAQDAFQRAGVVVAVGHTEADYATAAAAFRRGARVLTHAFNAMPPVLHRAPGPVLAAVDEGAVLELILDGVHVHDAVSRGLLRMAPARVALVTDAMSAAGCGDGEHVLGGLPVRVSGGVARLARHGALAGSTLTQDAALRRAVRDLGIDPVEAVAALTSVPARALGRGDLGTLTAGSRADLVLLEDWTASLVVGEGRELFAR